MNHAKFNYDIKLKGASLADIAKVASDSISALDGKELSCPSKMSQVTAEQKHSFATKEILQDV